MRNNKIDKFEQLCKILESKQDADDAEIATDYGEKYLYVKEKVAWYTNLERSKLLELKAETVDNDYSKYFTMMIAQIAFFLTIIQMLNSIISQAFSKIKVNVEVMSNPDFSKNMERIEIILNVALILFPVFIAVYWFKRLKDFEFTNKWRNYIIIAIDEIFKGIRENEKIDSSTSGTEKVIFDASKIGRSAMMEKTIIENRHEKALDYAVKVIKNSIIAPYVRKLYLYGSYARGTHAYSSDIDLFLVLNAEAKILHSKIMELKSEVTDADDFCGVEVDLKVAFGDAWMGSNQLYHKNVRKDGIEIWKKKN